MWDIEAAACVHNLQYSSVQFSTEIKLYSGCSQIVRPLRLTVHVFKTRELVCIILSEFVIVHVIVQS